jgi:hypothetical protein
MLDIVAGSYPFSSQDPDCGGPSPRACIADITDGGLSTEETSDNSINWWNAQIIFGEYQTLSTAAAWLDAFDAPAKVAPVVYIDPSGCSGQPPSPVGQLV